MTPANTYNVLHKIKRLSIVIVVMAMLFPAGRAFAQSGRYAGPQTKKLIGVTYTDSKKIPGLKGYQFREGSVATDITDPDMFLVDVFQKGTTYVVFFSTRTDSIENKQQILDVLEIKNVKPGWEVKTVLCREYQAENTFLVALVKSSTAQYSGPAKKAWRFSRDRIRFDAVDDPAKVDCLNEGSEQD